MERINRDLDSVLGKDSQEIAGLLRDIEILTRIEDKVVRGGEPKALSRSLLFFAAENVAAASYIDLNSRDKIKLYDLEMKRKPCELEESQEALDLFAGKYNADPNSVTENDALEALSELSDVCYNLVQLVGDNEFQTIVNSFSAKEDLFTHLMVIAKAKYSYRYLEIEPKDASEMVNVDYSERKQELELSARDQRRKDIELEINEVLMPIFEDEDGFLVRLLVNNWDHINTTLHAVYSTARTVALDLDRQAGLSVEDKSSLESQLIRALSKTQNLVSQESL